MGWEFYRSMRRAILFLVLFAILLAVALIGLPTLAARPDWPPAAGLSFPPVF